MTAKPPHRPDIDGLRAVAVLAVVLYHYGAAWLPGGFTGVDVFFVISGFVITRKLVSDIELDRFSFMAFYAARLRRIVPALAVMIAATLGIGWFLYMPAEYASLGESAAFAAAGLANVFFYANTGYFDISADSQPLLHTWSLGVEEQFYLVWPLFIWAAARLLPAKAIPRLLSLLVVLGLAFSIWQTHYNNSASFYLPFSRAWQLALGGLVTFARPIRRENLSIAASGLGLAMIAASLALVTAGPNFPGLGALPASMGAALLLIEVGRGHVFVRMLSMRAVTAVGRVSYSLYLWHWPVLVLYREYAMTQALSPSAITGLLAATGVLATASYLLVERPIRARNLAPSAGLGLAGIVLLVVVGSTVSSTGGVPSRLPDRALALAEAATDFSPYRPTCHRAYEFNPPLDQSCLFGAGSAPPDTVLWGDSHGVELSEAFAKGLAERGRSMFQMTYSSCPPAQNFTSPLQAGCEDFSAAVLRYLSDHPAIKNVYLATYYDLYFASDTQLWGGLRQTIAKLSSQGKNVTIVAPIPSPGYSVPQAAAKRSLSDPAARLYFPVSQHLRQEEKVSGEIARLKDEFPRLEVLDPASALCTQTCEMVVEGHPVLFDDNHLSRHGAEMVAKDYWARQ